MRVQLIAVGRVKAGPERELLRRYLDRAKAGARAVGLGDIVEIEIDESRARLADQRKRDEGEAITARLPADAEVRLLDEHGQGFTSPALAATISQARDDGRGVFAFVIGGADGLAPSLLARYPALQFGAATIPHQLARVLVAEQIYRAVTILSGHPYHRA